MKPVTIALVVFASLFSLTFASQKVKEYVSGIKWKEPQPVTSKAGLPPSDAKVIFNGTNKDGFDGAENWKIEEGILYSGKGTIKTKEKFGSCQIHLEFATPKEVKGDGQGRGNSGVYIMGIYEVQVLDSFENKTYFDGQCASIYKQYPPLVNASRGPGEWQSYDIIFDAPEFAEDKSVKKPAYVTVIHNGVVVQNHVELKGGTFYEKAPAYNAHAAKLPINIQDHGNPVGFRNIWVRDLAKLPAVEGDVNQEGCVLHIEDETK